VSSGLVASAAVDATISVDEVVGALQDTVSAETKVSAGPFSLPVAPLMALASRAFRAPRLTGSLHRDEDTLILTARQRGHSGLSWRVTPSADEPSANGDIAPPESEAAAHLHRPRAGTRRALGGEQSLRPRP
jgi:hypothetical protein